MPCLKHINISKQHYISLLTTTGRDLTGGVSTSTAFQITSVSWMLLRLWPHIFHNVTFTLTNLCNPLKRSWKKRRLTSGNYKLNWWLMIYMRRILIISLSMSMVTWHVWVAVKSRCGVYMKCMMPIINSLILKLLQGI